MQYESWNAKDSVVLVGFVAPMGTLQCFLRRPELLGDLSRIRFPPPEAVEHDRLFVLYCFSFTAYSLMGSLSGSDDID